MGVLLWVCVLSLVGRRARGVGGTTRFRFLVDKADVVALGADEIAKDAFEVVERGAYYWVDEGRSVSAAVGSVSVG